MEKLVLFVALMSLTACSGLDASVGFQSITSPATVSQCPYGGTLVYNSPVCNGAPGSVGATGPQGVAGTNGSTGATGPQGVAGTNGTNGSNGQNGNGFNPGVECDVYSIPTSTYSGTVNWNSLFSAGTLQFTTVLSNFNTPNQSDTSIFANFTPAQQALVGDTSFALDCEGWLNVPESGSYTLQLGSDDGSELALDNNVVINMEQIQAFASQSATVNLFAGLHKLNVLYFQGPAVADGLVLQWKGPSNAGLGTLSVVPASALSH